WHSGSRVFALATGEEASRLPAGKVSDREVRAAEVPTHRAEGERVAPPDLKARLAEGVREVLAKRWAPLYVEPGLAGRQFFFADSGDEFACLAWAYPHLPEGLQREVKVHLARAWRERFPLGREGRLALDRGEPREWFRVPAALRVRAGRASEPAPFGH